MTGKPPHIIIDGIADRVVPAVMYRRRFPGKSAHCIVVREHFRAVRIAVIVCLRKRLGVVVAAASLVAPGNPGAVLSSEPPVAKMKSLFGAGDPIGLTARLQPQPRRSCFERSAANFS